MPEIYVSTAQDIVGTEAQRSAALSGAAVGAYYFAEDTGLRYRKGTDLAWHIVRTPAGSQPPVVLSSTPTIDTNAYASGDNIGTTQTLSSERLTAHLAAGGAAYITAIEVDDKSTQAAPMDIRLYKEAIAGGGNDNAAFDPDDADQLLGIPGTPVSITNWFTNNDNCMGRSGPLAIPIISTNNANIYARVISRGTPTYASAADLTFRFVVELA